MICDTHSVLTNGNRYHSNIKVTVAGIKENPLDLNCLKAITMSKKMTKGHRAKG
ncbi:unnamed protein product, partial [Ceratitis capitata]